MAKNRSIDCLLVGSNSEHSLVLVEEDCLKSKDMDCIASAVASKIALLLSTFLTAIEFQDKDGCFVKVGGCFVNVENESVGADEDVEYGKEPDYTEPLRYSGTNLLV